MNDDGADRARSTVSVPEPGDRTVERGLVEELRFGDDELFVRINGNHPSRQGEQSAADLVRHALRELAALPGIGDKGDARGRFAHASRITIIDPQSELALQRQSLSSTPLEPGSTPKKLTQT